MTEQLAVSHVDDIMNTDPLSFDPLDPNYAEDYRSYDASPLPQGKTLGEVMRDIAEREDIFADYDGPDNPWPVRVRFPMVEEYWNKVVDEANESLSIESEGMDFFIVEYQTSASWTHALERFDGMIPYKILDSKKGA
jgi:hypothetical protein